VPAIAPGLTFLVEYGHLLIGRRPGNTSIPNFFNCFPRCAGSRRQPP
jgi:hypothetical protein